MLDNWQCSKWEVQFYNIPLFVFTFEGSIKVEITSRHLWSMGRSKDLCVKAIVFQNGKTKEVPISDHCTRLSIPNIVKHHLHVWSPASIYPAPLHNLPIKRKLLSVTQKQEQEFWIINKTALRNLYTVENNNNSEHKFLPEFNWPKMYSVKAVLNWPKMKSCTRVSEVILYFPAVSKSSEVVK